MIIGAVIRSPLTSIVLWQTKRPSPLYTVTRVLPRYRASMDAAASSASGDRAANDLFPVNGIDMDIDAKVARMLDDLHDVGGMDQLLGGDAAAIDAGAAERSGLHNGDGHALGIAESAMLTPDPVPITITSNARASLVMVSPSSRPRGAAIAALIGATGVVRALSCPAVLAENVPQRARTACPTLGSKPATRLVG